jgi:hypothetical protein
MWLFIFISPLHVSTLAGHLPENNCVFHLKMTSEAESQAVLNTLTEHDSQDAFKKWQKRWDWCIGAEGVIHTHPHHVLSQAVYSRQQTQHPVRLI